MDFAKLYLELQRGIGTSIATGCNWGANLVIASTYLSLMDAITPSGAFGFYAGLCCKIATLKKKVCI